MVALVGAKMAECMEELEADDPRELMSPEMTKWEKISIAVNACHGISCYRSPGGVQIQVANLIA